MINKSSSKGRILELDGLRGFGNLGMAVRERLEVLPIIVLLALLFGTRRGRWYLETRSAGGAS